MSGEEFFFLEMNTRIQVEHTVTEVVTGLDLVREQVRVAAGEPLSISQDAGRAARARHRVPHQRRGRLEALPPLPRPHHRPTASRPGPGVRVDSGVRAGSDIPEIYDPMVAKLIVWDVDRESARRRMIRALDEYVVEGPTTLIPFHRWLLEQEEFIAGGACHALLARLAEEPTPIPPPEAPGPRLPADPAPEAEPTVERHFTAEVDGRRFEVVLRPRRPRPARAARRRPAARGRTGRARGRRPGASGNALVTPMQGTVLRVARGGRPGGRRPATWSAIVEAMKMENEVAAHRDGTVTELRATEGGSVAAGDVLAVIE